MCAEVNARFDPGFWQLKENSVLQFKEVSVEGTVLPLGWHAWIRVANIKIFSLIFLRLI